MQSFRTIEIDYDVHRLIEFERGHVQETPNDVLRRLLDIDADRVDSGKTAQTAA